VPVYRFLPEFQVGTDEGGGDLVVGIVQGWKSSLRLLLKWRKVQGRGGDGRLKPHGIKDIHPLKTQNTLETVPNDQDEDRNRPRFPTIQRLPRKYCTRLKGGMRCCSGNVKGNLVGMEFEHERVF